MNDTPLWAWIVFNVFVLIMLVLDLAVFHRKAHTVRFRESLFWTAFWISLALLFNFLILKVYDRQHALEFFTGYLIELSLSVDNLFVFLLIFSFFRVLPEHQHKVLFWGILGAVIMRALFILLGVAAIQKYHWIIYIFGAFLVYTGVKLAMHRDTEVHPDRNLIIRIARKLIPIAPNTEGGHFFTRVNGKLAATPLFLVLLCVESTDVIFAVDSIPAILGVTKHPFIAYTSNVFAVLGLRSIYFALAGLMRLFHYLSFGLSMVLVFIGVKMLLGIWHLHLPIGVTLGVVVGVLLLSIVASLIWPAKTEDMNVDPEVIPNADEATREP